MKLLVVDSKQADGLDVVMRAMRVNTNPGYFPTDPVTRQGPGMLATAITWLGIGITIGDLLQQSINHAIGIIIPTPYSRADVINSPPAQRTYAAQIGPPYIPLGGNLSTSPGPH